MVEALQCLADNIYNEAAFESTEGQLGVATVTLNRVNTPGYPNTVCGVVYERHMDRHSHKMVCQFSWTCKRAIKRLHKKYEEVRQVAKEALFKHIRLAELEGVTLYHADYVHPDWADKESQVTQIGRHIFYREQL